MKLSCGYLRLAAFAFVLGGFTPLLSAQGLSDRDDFSLILDAPSRQNIVRSVMTQRGILFRTEGILDGCSHANTLGDSTVSDTALRLLFGTSVRGGPVGGCLSEMSIAREAPGEVVFFRRLRHETDELISTHDGLARRQAGLVVLQLIARKPRAGESRTEEWVMREARPGSWTVETVRIFGFGHT
jgi:hypothetical protein